MADCVESVVIYENGELDITLTCNNEIGELINKYSAEI